MNYHRQAYHDVKENRLVFPDDELLNIKQGQGQLDLVKRIVKAGLEVPYADAVDLCESLMGIRISEGVIHPGLIQVTFRDSWRAAKTWHKFEIQVENLLS